jgi:hypothetical protein
MTKFPLILGIVFCMAVLLAIRLTGSARKKRRAGGGGHFGWALLFLMSGRMPPPPPETQIEAEANTEKDRNHSDLLGKPGGDRIVVPPATPTSDAGTD